MINDARMALRMLDGRVLVGSGGETLYVGLSRPPAVHPIRCGGGYIGFGLGTGEEEQDDLRVLSV
jgi:hypothetical protein